MVLAQGKSRVIILYLNNWYFHCLVIYCVAIVTFFPYSCLCSFLNNEGTHLSFSKPKTPHRINYNNQQHFPSSIVKQLPEISLEGDKFLSNSF